MESASPQLSKGLQIGRSNFALWRPVVAAHSLNGQLLLLAARSRLPLKLACS